jgi:hydroxymethylglutaryl-CoA reductase
MSNDCSQSILKPSSRLQGFYALTLAERRRLLAMHADLPLEGLEVFDPPSGLTAQQADSMVENCVGVFGLPLGIAANFIVDGEPVLVPMVTEEPSIVAAASHIAKLVSTCGGFSTVVDEPIMIGQIYFPKIASTKDPALLLHAHQDELLAFANTFCPGLMARGGGVTALSLNTVQPDEGAPFYVVHVHVNCKNAMGANVVNTIAEGLLPRLESLFDARSGMAILSNLADQRLARARCELPVSLLTQDLLHRMADAWRFADADPYRAATHNKGIMNGVDALAVATGNDFRAVEAGAHAFAARNGRYRSLSKFELSSAKDALCCSIELPLAVGVVGGNIAVHPGVRKNLEILGSFGACSKKLAGLMASVGLAQNIAAVRALCFEGIQKGHMRLHARKDGIICA